MYNILLQPLSTFSGRFVENYYKYDDYPIFNGFHTGEIAPKALIQELNKHNQSLDEIIVLGTKQTGESMPLAKISENIDFSQLGIYDDISPYDFVQKRVGDFAKEYKRNPPKYNAYNVEDFNSNKIISQTIAMSKYVKSIFEDNSGSCRLYIDAQGGLRDALLMFLTVIRFLEIEGINYEKIFLTHFGSGATIDGKYNGLDIKCTPVYDTSNAFSFLTLSSGVDEFVNYARANSLKRFFKDYNNDSVKLITQNIGDIADSLQICNMNNFEKEVKEFIETTEEDKLKSLKKKFPLFTHTVEIIREEYLSFYDKKDNKTKFILLIDWCIRKGFYQQAATLLETNTIKELYSNDILPYNKKMLKDLWKNRDKDSKDREYIYKISPAKYLVEVKNFGKNNSGKNITVEKNIDFIKDPANLERTLTAQEIDNLSQIFKLYFTIYDKKSNNKFVGIKKLRNASNHGNSTQTAKDFKNEIENFIFYLKRAGLK